MKKSTDIYIDIIRRCQRLLRLLYHGQQQHQHFNDLYFHVLEQSSRSDNAKIVTVVLQQIAVHLFESTKNSKVHQRLANCLPPDSPAQQALSTAIQTYLSISKTEEDPTHTMLAHHLDILYPFTANFLDARREFRDCTQYFIDGDSLLLSIAHHANVHLAASYGHTLHVIFIIERILLTLFNQAHQCNYALVFFDCHHQLYRHEASILSLLRAGLIAHLSHNADKHGRAKIHQFSSWLDEDYLRFAREEKPMFLFYHDISTLSVEPANLLSASALENLLIVYRLFGNYHQYVFQCHLYLMNKLFLSETTVTCFQVQFYRMCPRSLLTKVVQTEPKPASTNGIEALELRDFEKVCRESNDGDVRVFLYLKTIADLMKDLNERTLVERLCPLLILHVALLVRLSLLDRHLSNSTASLTFSPTVSQLLARFQQQLATSLSNCSLDLSWLKVADLFDGRLFLFTLEQIHRSQSTVRLDSNTLDIVQRCLTSLNLSYTDRLFHDLLDQMVQGNEIQFSPVASVSPVVKGEQRQKITQISNPLTEAYLKPILNSNKDSRTFDLVSPNGRQVASYPGKHIWTDYKEV